MDSAITEHRLRQKIFFHFPKNINAQLYFNSKCSDFVREGAAGLSPGQCVSACSGAGYSYAGLGGGRGCYCGHTHPRHQDRSHVTQSESFLLSLPTLCCPGPCLISFYMQILMLSPTVPLTALCRYYDVTPPTPNPLPHLPVQKALLFLF